MAGTNTWRDLFGCWPADVPRRGVLVVSFGEQIPFAGFSSSDGFLLLDRQSPDAMGGRTIILPYDQILGLKFLDVLKPKAFQPLGFAGSTPKK